MLRAEKQCCKRTVRTLTLVGYASESGSTLGEIFPHARSTTKYLYMYEVPPDADYVEGGARYLCPQFIPTPHLDQFP